MFLGLARLKSVMKLQKCIRITIFKISFREVYRRIYGQKSRFTSQSDYFVSMRSFFVLSYFWFPFGIVELLAYCKGGTS